MIYVCGLAEMAMHCETLRPSHLVSLVESEEQPPTPRCIHAEHHHRVEIHDINGPIEGQVLAERHHVEALIDFLETWPRTDPLLVHCFAGISRSTGAALVALALRAEGREAEVARTMREAAPHAFPNRRIVSLADEVLGRSGRLVAACDAMGPPHGMLLEAPLVRLDLPRQA